MPELALLLVLLIANGSPVAARAMLRGHGARPLDNGFRLEDGRPLFGASKTIRGVIAAVSSSTLAAPLLGLPWWVGTMIGALAMVGDLLSSFIKRRRGLPSGASAAGLDHIPESVLPLLACMPVLDLSLLQVVGLSLAFMVADLALSRWLHGLGIGNHPH